MILADKIIELRKKSGWSQEELAEKLGVSRQSISKWEGAQSVPDMNRIIKMSEVFGVSTDYLLKDEMEQPETGELREDVPEVRRVTMEEADAFLRHNRGSAWRVPLGVMLCILSPVFLILLGVSVEGGRLTMTEDRTAALGLIVLFLMVAAAVALFVYTAISGQRYEYLEKEVIETAYGVEGMARERWEQFKQSFTIMMVVGIVLCVLSVIPIFISAAVYEDNDFAGGIGVVILFLFIAVGVFLIVRACIIKGGYDKLLQCGEYTQEQKIENQRNATLASIYWGVCVVLYLLISFLTQAWHLTWIIWPVAGVAYGVVAAILKATRNS